MASLIVPALTKAFILRPIFVNVIKEKWLGSNLEETIEMHGQQWSKAKILTVLVKHLIHHRAQITILMFAADVQVPDIYGPSREEWSKFGLETRE